MVDATKWKQPRISVLYCNGVDKIIEMGSVDVRISVVVDVGEPKMESRRVTQVSARLTLFSPK
jgi:hypothetical protein